MKLISPTVDLQSEFLSFYQDFVQNDAPNAEYYGQGSIDFPHYVKQLNEEEQGINLRDGYVPCSHYWLVDEACNILGVIRVRHNIDNEFLKLEAGHIGYDIAPSFRGLGHGKVMLKLALLKAKALGITKALITANEDNFASRKVIEANGGQFENIVKGKVFQTSLARYWVDCH